jgi:hypothetical protein
MNENELKIEILIERKKKCKLMKKYCKKINFCFRTEKINNI